MDSKPDSEMEPLLLTTREAARILGVKPETLVIQRLRGIGPAYLKMGSGPNGRVRYKRVDVIAYIDSCQRIEPVKQVA